MRKNKLHSIAAVIGLLSLSISSLGQSKAFDPANLDRAADACVDFYQFANGGWLKRTEIPPTESRWGTFNILADRNNAMLKEVLETASSSKARPGSNQRLIGDFYAACMDEAGIEKAGLEPIKPFLDSIDSIKTVGDLKKQIAELQNNGFPAVFSFGVGPDLKNSNIVILNAGQGGLTLPNRDYYTQTDPKSVEVRERFVAYVSNMFKLLGEDQETAAANAAKILAMQTRLANASLTPVERRNPDNNYNKISIAAAAELTPHFSWTEFLQYRQIPPTEELNIAPPKFFKEMDAMLGDVPLEDWKIFLRWSVLNAAAPGLPKAFADKILISSDAI